VSLVTEVDAGFQKLAHRKIRQCHALLLLFRLNLRKANSILFEDATGRKRRISPGRSHALRVECAWPYIRFSAKARLAPKNLTRTDE
jgi:hypothetical protein